MESFNRYMGHTTREGKINEKISQHHDGLVTHTLNQLVFPGNFPSRFSVAWHATAMDDFHEFLFNYYFDTEKEIGNFSHEPALLGSVPNTPSIVYWFFFSPAKYITHFTAPSRYINEIKEWIFPRLGRARIWKQFLHFSAVYLTIISRIKELNKRNTCTVAVRSCLKGFKVKIKESGIKMGKERSLWAK